MAVIPQEVNEAAHAVLPVVKQLRDLSAGMINPVAGTTLPHQDTIDALIVEAVAVRAEWFVVRDALDAALTP